MSNEILQKQDTDIVWTSAGGDETLTLTSLANGDGRAGDELGLVVPAPEPLERMERNGRDHDRPRSAKSAPGAQAGQTAQGNGRLEVARELEPQDELLGGTPIERTGRAAVESQ